MINPTITSGILNYPTTQSESDSSVWMHLSDMLGKDSNYEIVSVHPKREEMLLKIHDFSLFNTENIRGLLQELQQQSQRSFVALINMSTHYVLITVRG